jgi:rod shape-determining protein MreD
MSRSDLPGFLLSLLLALVLQVIDLPDAVSAARPLLLALTLAYWALHAPEMPVLPAAWLLGLCCDVLYNAPLGQYALGLLLVAYLARRFAGAIVVFALWQATLALAVIWTAYVFLMFWIDGLTHHSADPLQRWLPLVTTVAVWPLAATLLSSLRSRRSRRGMLH